MEIVLLVLALLISVGGLLIPKQYLRGYVVLAVFLLAVVGLATWLSR